MGGGEEVVVAWGKTDAAELVLDVDARHTAFIGGRGCWIGTGEVILRSYETWWSIACIRIRVGVPVWR